MYLSRSLFVIVAVFIKMEEIVMEEYEGLHTIKESWKIYFINLTTCIVILLLFGFGIRYAHRITENEDNQKKIKFEQTRSNINNSEEMAN